MKKNLEKIREKKGFTLAELLIVVAIIAVLVAISVPVFSAQLNQSKYATDVANARSIYSELAADYLTNIGKAQKDNKNIKIEGISDGVALTTDENTKITITIGSTVNEYKFNGVSKLTVHLGTSTVAPWVEISPKEEAFGDSAVFGTQPKSGT